MDERLIVAIQAIKPYSRVRISFDDEESYVLPRRVFRQRKLREGEAFPEDYIAWSEQAQMAACWDTSLYYLTSRMRSSGQTRKYLFNKGYHEGAVEAALDKLEEYGYLDDAQFAEMMLRGADKGKRALKQELRLKGLEEDVIEASLADIGEEQQREAAEKHARKALNRAKAGEDIWKTRKRISDTLARKGFDWDIIRAVIEDILAEE